MNFRTAAHEAIAKAFNPHRFNGYIPDADHKRRQKDSRLKFGASPAVPRQASLAKYRGPILDQGQTGSCTGHGTSQAVYTSCGASGNPLPFFPSPGITYKVVRVLERADASVPLGDTGAMPSDLLTVLRSFGIAPMQGPTPDGRNSDVWGPADAPNPNVNLEPNLLDLETAGLKLVTGEYRVDETNGDAAQQIQASIASNAAAGIGIFIDVRHFMQWDPSSGPISLMNLADPQGGGHWLALDYFYTTNAGLVVFGGPNSWSVTWPNGSGSPPESPYWQPGCYEITAPCLGSVMSDCLLFPTKVLS
jgi:hypothetical protein